MQKTHIESFNTKTCTAQILRIFTFLSTILRTKPILLEVFVRDSNWLFGRCFKYLRELRICLESVRIIDVKPIYS